MRLTEQRLKKIIREELEYLNEGTGTILALLFINRELSNRHEREAERQKELPVKSSHYRRTERVLMAALILNAIAKIAGSLMEEMDYDMGDDSLHNQVASEVSDILNLSPSEVSAMIEEFDLVRFYEENK